ncbi:hypothetical protein LF41_2687 [Lysobacter dokdonensis DS-58]|uniref:Lipoprotein n=1 Tax=Lysobacter dokdonensis DS-58 TaxID=1300345 RepID=A0A0A2WN90_9GAMM|nr:hypothetical protein [Lysobacter dokdonensis]KGQ19745.1 hypothetical protein LF41_2687 [Lysobacter dokdonensis DS-58]
MRAVPAAFVVALSFAGCGSMPMRKVTVDPARLNLDAQMAVQCPYRLKDVVDARPANSGFGTMGRTAFVIEDPARMVRDQLRTIGLSEAGEGPDVSIRLMQLYIATNRVTNVPVAVYEAKIGNAEPVVIRGQPASMTWWGTDAESAGALALALREANRGLVARLNRGCPAI